MLSLHKLTRVQFLNIAMLGIHSQGDFTAHQLPGKHADYGTARSRSVGS